MDDQLYRQRTMMFLALCVWLVVMNTTMFNVALPTIMNDFTLLPSQGAWIVSGYSIVLAIATITYTRLSDFVPIRRLMVIGICLFAVASLVGLFSNSFATLLLARLFQAMGAAAIPGLSMVYASRFIGPAKRGHAVSYIASATSLGFGLGPVVGGAVTEYIHWSGLFVITLFVLLFIPIIVKRLPTEKSRKVRFDYIGGVLTGTGVTSFLLFISMNDWWLLAIALVLFSAVWFRIHQTDEPFIRPELLRMSGYRYILYMSFIGFTTHFALLIAMPLMLQFVFNQAPSSVGLIIFPGAMVSALAAGFVGRMIGKFGNVYVMLIANACLWVSAIMFYFLSPIHESFIALSYMLTSFGFASLSSSSTNEVSMILSPEQVASAIGLKQLTQFVGSASGAVLGALLIELGGAGYPVSAFQMTYVALIGITTLSIILLFSYARWKRIWLSSRESVSKVS
ncbi:MFS transporter [Mangrovibacillus cuniculi]|uniref:MFS transporter n=1 Tax=Mangrovibacillus cuniculi TaxID=2593652 RepID=A0A7S8HGB2_9BACI|nr:MFS transporter [Mangrovibacillus cuniculi]QPC47809.1 MFS transporter [Mangrovibacillus cuniculi]